MGQYFMCEYTFLHTLSRAHIHKQIHAQLKPTHPYCCYVNISSYPCIHSQKHIYIYTQQIRTAASAEGPAGGILPVDSLSPGQIYIVAECCRVLQYFSPARGVLSVDLLLPGYICVGSALQCIAVYYRVVVSHSCWKSLSCASPPSRGYG